MRSTATTTGDQRRRSTISLQKMRFSLPDILGQQSARTSLSAPVSCRKPRLAGLDRLVPFQIGVPELRDHRPQRDGAQQRAVADQHQQDIAQPLGRRPCRGDRQPRPGRWRWPTSRGSRPDDDVAPRPATGPTARRRIRRRGFSPSTASIMTPSESRPGKAMPSNQHPPGGRRIDGERKQRLEEIADEGDAPEGGEGRRRPGRPEHR